MRHDARARILEKTSWGDFHRLKFAVPEMSAEAGPGQFVMVRTAPGDDPLLRRPISLHDAGDGWLEIFFRVAGRGTALLAAKREGDELDVIGPLGRGYRLDGAWKGKPAWLVGGGRGIAPLFFLGRRLKARGARVRVLYGGKTAAEVPLADGFRAAGLDPIVSTDDGSLGFPGFVTDLLDRELQAAQAAPKALFACGPDLMMAKAAKLAAARAIPAQVSLEAIMGCGFGVCWGCVHRIRRDDAGTWRKICQDGPVFAAEEVVWDGD